LNKQLKKCTRLYKFWRGLKTSHKGERARRNPGMYFLTTSPLP
jgi:hypothetical protein